MEPLLGSRQPSKPQALSTGLQSRLTQYCEERSRSLDHSEQEVREGQSRKPAAPRQLQVNTSDPVFPSHRGREADADRTPRVHQFRQHYRRLAGTDTGGEAQDEGALDFVLDVVYDVQEHYERMASANRFAAWRSDGAMDEAPEVTPVGRQSSDTATVLVILKSFVGGTLLVVPRAFLEAGVLSSVVIFWAVGLLMLWCMLKLLEAHRLYGASFATLAGTAMGDWGSVAVETAIVSSQLGYIAAEMIYVARNGATAIWWFQAQFPEVVTWFQTLWVLPAVEASASTVITWCQLILVVPVAWYRELPALTIFNLIGNVLVFGTALALSIGTAWGLMSEGTASDLQLLCPLNEALSFMGFSVFAFEGINMVIPMYTAHRNKESYAMLLSVTIVVIILIFSTFALANIALYGGSLQPILTQNMPAENFAAGLVPLAFGVASLVLVPLMAFPAFEILEGVAQRVCPQLLLSSARVDMGRTAVLVFCATLAQFGGNHLQIFLSIIGAAACGPLSLIIPAIIHLRMVAETRLQVIDDVCCAILGCAITIFSICSTVCSA